MQIKPLFFLFFFYLTACGYQLRGEVDIPEGMGNIYLDHASKPLSKEFRDLLKFSQGKLVKIPSEAGIILQIHSEKMRNRVLAVSSTGKANQFEMEYKINYSILDASGKSLMDNQRIEIKRDYFNDQEDILGQTLEEEMIRKEMYTQAVRSILRRYHIALSKKTQ